MAVTNERLSTVKFADPAELEEFQDYGFKSYEEKPSKRRHISVSEKAYNEIEEYCKQSGEKQVYLCGRIITEAVKQEYKPVKKGIQKNHKLTMDLTKSVTAYLKETDNAKVDVLAKSLNMTPADYMRLCIYQALKGWKQN